jgi:glutathionylspermidine synthase
MRLATESRIRAGDSLDRQVFEGIRRRAVLEGCKWDPQVGDVSTLAEFPLFLSRRSWDELATLAERLTSEALAAEGEVLHRPDLLKGLGLPRRIRAALRGDGPPSPAAARAMRFDFHPTTDGWRISEVNSDVPGGFTEGSFFTELIAANVGGARPAAVPITPWADAIARAAGQRGRVGLLSAPGFMEDHQIVAYLAEQLRARGCETHITNPRQLTWRNGEAHLAAAWYEGRLDAVVRFYQGEWLASLSPAHWTGLFRGGRTPIANPGAAVIPESKRFPLVWEHLRTPMPTWRSLLPESRDPRDAPWSSDDGWLVKSAMSNTGDTVSMRDSMSAREWRRVFWSVTLCPWGWIAQRRFESRPIDTPRGAMHACLGVYTIDGVAAGAYARLSQKPVIDYEAVDCALLVEPGE